MTRGWFVGWSAFVGIWSVVLAASFADDDACSFICFTFGDMLVILCPGRARVVGGVDSAPRRAALARTQIVE
jgi:hypothetical protein